MPDDPTALLLEALTAGLLNGRCSQMAYHNRFGVFGRHVAPGVRTGSVRRSPATHFVLSRLLNGGWRKEIDLKREEKEGEEDIQIYRCRSFKSVVRITNRYISAS